MIYLNKSRMISAQEWKEIVDGLTLGKKIEAAKVIVIKPNFTAGAYAEPKAHANSDLSLLRSCILFLAKKNSNAIIYIGEADTLGYNFAYLKFEHLGLPESLNLPASVAERVRLLDLTRDRLVWVEDKKFTFYTSDDRKLFLSRTLMEADFRISLSNLKKHDIAGYTGACKNLFGCLPDFDKSVHHPNIDKVVHDLVVAVQPDLSIVDAFYGMEKNGPIQGEDVDAGFRVISDNSVEADVYAAKAVAYPAKDVGYLKLLCQTYGINLDPDVKVMRKFAKPGFFLRVKNTLGLRIQGCGQTIAAFGHKIYIRSCKFF